MGYPEDKIQDIKRSIAILRERQKFLETGPNMTGKRDAHVPVMDTTQDDLKRTKTQIVEYEEILWQLERGESL
jgi:hypothetical protein